MLIKGFLGNIAQSISSDLIDEYEVLDFVKFSSTVKFKAKKVVPEKRCRSQQSEFICSTVITHAN